jgi:NDP-sugar pyrophosphorylase family protein
MGPDLLVLAAGMGSRYGGLKQLDPVGPGGETILDYAVYDALRAGFGRVVFVIRRDFEAQFREKVMAKYAGRAPVAAVFQSIDDLPGGAAATARREKPWGTGHAVWCAREAIRENFAVINADDFYGADAFVQLARFLGEPQVRRRFAMIGFRLARTLSENGAVSRGVCLVADGRLQSIVERTGIAAADVGPGRTFTGEEIVSLNCWGFTPALFPALGEDFQEFLGARGADPAAEFYLPAAVSAMIARAEVSVEVKPTSGAWFGVTHPADRPRAAAAIAELVRQGAYPSRLF